LARLLGEEPEALEDGLRMELRRLAEAERPPVGRPQGSNERSAGHRQAARKPGGSAPSPAAADLSGYPKPLQDHRAVAQRAAWDALTNVPMTVRELAQRAGLELPAADAALRALRRHGLATTDGSVPARWMRRQP
jgi:DNA-binding transcriptional ArsR family regulator